MVRIKDTNLWMNIIKNSSVWIDDKFNNTFSIFGGLSENCSVIPAEGNLTIIIAPNSTGSLSLLYYLSQDNTSRIEACRLVVVARSSESAVSLRMTIYGANKNYTTTFKAMDNPLSLYALYMYNKEKVRAIELTFKIDVNSHEYITIEIMFVALI